MENTTDLRLLADAGELQVSSNVASMNATDIVRVHLDAGGLAPQRAHEDNPVLDIKSPIKVTIPPHAQVNIHTRVHVQLPPTTFGIIASRFDAFLKRGVFTTGIILGGCDCEIVVGLRNLDDRKVSISRGDNIAQLLIMPVSSPLTIELDVSAAQDDE